MTDEVKRFSARWSFIVWVITIAVGFLVFVLIPFKMIEAVRSESVIKEYSQNQLVLAGFVPLIFFLAIFFAPLSYAIGDMNVIVRRLGFNIVIPVSCIEEIRRTTLKEIGFCIRLGMGGFFGGYGIFFSLGLGVFRAYVTNGRSLVFIKCDDGKKIVLSPDRAEEFVGLIAELQSPRNPKKPFIRLDVPDY